MRFEVHFRKARQLTGKDVESFETTWEEGTKDSVKIFGGIYLILLVSYMVFKLKNQVKKDDHAELNSRERNLSHLLSAYETLGEREISVAMLREKLIYRVNNGVELPSTIIAIPDHALERGVKLLGGGTEDYRLNTDWYDLEMDTHLWYEKKRNE